MSGNRTTELVSRREAKTLLEEFLCGYQNILLSRGINASEAVCKQNELIDEYAERIEQAIAATVGQGTCIPHGEWERLSQTVEFRRMYCDCGYELGMDSRGSFPFARITAYAAMPRFCPECGARIVSKGKAVKR